MNAAPTSLARLRRDWRLAPDGAPFATASSLLQPVRTESGRAAMLKLARLAEEARGSQALAGWTGEGAAPVVRSRGPALLLARASSGDLVAMHRRGAEDEALDRIADVARALHAGHVPAAATVPLERWFAALQRVAAWRGGWWRVAWAHAESLLASPRDDVPLHGDLHHGNVLRFEGAGWRAIDPKALRGDPAFEFAAPLLNPERVTPGSDPTVLRARALRLAVRSGQEVGRVLAWTEAFASLSAAWAVEEGGDPAVDLAWWRLARAARAGG